MSFEFPDGLRPLVPDFPDEIAGDGVLVRTPTHEDVLLLAPAFRDPAVGGEAGLPPFGKEEIHTFIDHELPLWRASGQRQHEQPDQSAGQPRRPDYPAGKVGERHG